MIHKLLRSRRRPKMFALPDGQRVYAIGDIHGRLDLLNDLLARIDADDTERGAAQTTLIFLGDIVDRGPESAGVVERLRRLSLERANVRVLTGNHEEVFLGALQGEPKALRLFCRIGGAETAISYGIPAEQYERLDYEELMHLLAESVPATHCAFMAGFEDMIVLGDYVFVHAGIRPGKPLDQQQRSDLRWIRDPFLGHKGALEKMVIHGHTMSNGVDYQPHRIGVDTGAFESGTLTALGLEATGTWELQSRMAPSAR